MRNRNKAYEKAYMARFAPGVQTGNVQVRTGAACRNRTDDHPGVCTRYAFQRLATPVKE